MASSVSSDTQLAVLNTEHTLYTTASAGTYILSVDLTNMLNGDRIELRIKKPVISGGSTIGVFVRNFANQCGVDECVVESIAVVCPFGVTVTLKQVVGTGRSFPWSVNIP